MQAQGEAEHGEAVAEGLRGQLPQVAGPPLLLLQAGDSPLLCLHLLHSSLTLCCPTCSALSWKAKGITFSGLHTRILAEHGFRLRGLMLQSLPAIVCPLLYILEGKD